MPSHKPAVVAGTALNGPLHCDAVAARTSSEERLHAAEVTLRPGHVGHREEEEDGGEDGIDHREQQDGAESRVEEDCAAKHDGARRSCARAGSSC